MMVFKDDAQVAVLRLDGIPHINYTKCEYVLKNSQLDGLLYGRISDQVTTKGTVRAQIPHIYVIDIVCSQKYGYYYVCQATIPK